MNEFGNRIIKLRKEKGLSQTELANIVGIFYTQIGKYETKGAQPTSEVFKKMADALDTTSDFLINGSKDEKALTTLNDNELLQQFKEVDKMSNDDKATIKKLIDAFITKNKIKQLIL